MKLSWLIIGAPRCGTSTLFANIVKHPDIGGQGQTKEIAYFSDADRFHRGLKWYRKQLKGKLLGEATPRYLAEPRVAFRVSKAFPEVKLIALVRDAPERAYSAWAQDYRLGRLRPQEETFKQAIESEIERLESGRVIDIPSPDRRFVWPGLYRQHLERWLMHFPSKQLLVLKSERLFTNHRAVLADVFQFIGVDDSLDLEVERRTPSIRFADQDVPVPPSADPETMNRLLHYYRDRADG